MTDRNGNRQDNPFSDTYRRETERIQQQRRNVPNVGRGMQHKIPKDEYAVEMYPKVQEISGLGGIRHQYDETRRGGSGDSRRQQPQPINESSDPRLRRGMSAPATTHGISTSSADKYPERWHDSSERPPLHANVGPRSASDVVETFTSPGKILKQNESFMFNNTFVSPQVLAQDTGREFKTKFRRYYEEQEREEQQMQQVQVAENDLLKRQAFHSASKVLSDPYSKADTTKNPYNESFENSRYNKPLITPVHVASEDRDLVRYPIPNDYRIFLPRVFKNVKKIRLVSTEIPNTDQVVRDDPAEVKRAKNQRKMKCGELLNVANKNLYWIDEEDANEDYSCLIYKACITPGNYVAETCECDERTIQSEIEARVSEVNTFQESFPHQFIVTIDPQTNRVAILSINSITLEVNPIASQAGTNILIITHPNHPFQVGDTATILGSGSVGGIPATTINGEHVVQDVVDENTYEIRVTTIASFTTEGGGANVTSGENRPFQALFSNKDTIGEILGFPQQDSSEAIATNITFINSGPPDISDPAAVKPPPDFTEIDFDRVGDFNAWIRSPGHDLVPGDEIFIRDTNTIPDINGLQTVEEVIDENNFTIGKPVKVVNNQTTTFETRLGSIKRVLDDVPTCVTNIFPGFQGFIQTNGPHHIELGCQIYIGNVVGGLLENGNSIDQFHILTSNIAVNQFGIDNQEILFEGDYTTNDAFVVKTESTQLMPIKSIIPANNGTFCPPIIDDPCCAIELSSRFAGDDVPEYVLFRGTETRPNINGVISVDVDAIGNCGNVELLTPPLIGTASFISQSWVNNYGDEDCGECPCLGTPIPNTHLSELVGMYIKVGNGSIGSIATLNIYASDGTTNLGFSQPVDLSVNAAIGIYFCLPNIPLELGETYIWELEVALTSCYVICGDDVSVSGPIGGGVADILTTPRPDFEYSFRTFMSPGVKDVDYYSENTGVFDTFTRICEVFNQNPNQAFLRSLDSELQCIESAKIKSNGTWFFGESHGCVSGDMIYVRSTALPPANTTEPFVKPDVLGIQTVQTIFGDREFDTETTITSSMYSDTIDELELAIVKTNDMFPTPIQNVYPKNNGYLGKDNDDCDPNKEQCVLCPCDQIIVRGSLLKDESISYEFSCSKMDFPLKQCHKINQIFSGVSEICDDIFDTETCIGDPLDTGIPPQFIRDLAVSPAGINEQGFMYTHFFNIVQPLGVIETAEISRIFNADGARLNSFPPASSSICFDSTQNQYHVWFNVDGIDTPPTPGPGFTLVEVIVSSTDSSANVNANLAAAIDALPDITVIFQGLDDPGNPDNQNRLDFQNNNSGSAVDINDCGFNVNLNTTLVLQQGGLVGQDPEQLIELECQQQGTGKVFEFEFPEISSDPIEQQNALQNSFPIVYKPLVLKKKGGFVRRASEPDIPIFDEDVFLNAGTFLENFFNQAEVCCFQYVTGTAEDACFEEDRPDLDLREVGKWEFNDVTKAVNVSSFSCNTSNTVEPPNSRRFVSRSHVGDHALYTPQAFENIIGHWSHVSDGYVTVYDRFENKKGGNTDEPLSNFVVGSCCKILPYRVYGNWSSDAVTWEDDEITDRDPGTGIMNPMSGRWCSTGNLDPAFFVNASNESQNRVRKHNVRVIDPLNTIASQFQSNNNDERIWNLKSTIFPLYGRGVGIESTLGSYWDITFPQAFYHSGFLDTIPATGKIKVQVIERNITYGYYDQVERTNVIYTKKHSNVIYVDVGKILGFHGDFNVCPLSSATQPYGLIHISGATEYNGIPANELNGFHYVRASENCPQDRTTTNNYADPNDEWQRHREGRSFTFFVDTCASADSITNANVPPGFFNPPTMGTGGGGTTTITLIRINNCSVDEDVPIGPVGVGGDEGGIIGSSFDNLTFGIYPYEVIGEKSIRLFYSILDVPTGCSVTPPPIPDLNLPPNGDFISEYPGIADSNGQLTQPYPVDPSLDDLKTPYFARQIDVIFTDVCPSINLLEEPIGSTFLQNGDGTNRTDINGGCVRLDENGGVPGRNGTFVEACVKYDPEIIDTGLEDLQAIASINEGFSGGRTEPADGDYFRLFTPDSKCYVIYFGTSTANNPQIANCKSLGPITGTDSLKWTQICDAIDNDPDATNDFNCFPTQNGPPGFFVGISIQAVMPGFVQPIALDGPAPLRSTGFNFQQNQFGSVSQIINAPTSLQVCTKLPHGLQSGDNIYISHNSKVCNMSGIYTFGGESTVDVVPLPTYLPWALGVIYVLGFQVSHEGGVYQAIVNPTHVSATINEPVNGTDWMQFWVFLPDADKSCGDISAGGGPATLYTRRLDVGGGQPLVNYEVKGFATPDGSGMDITYPSPLDFTIPNFEASKARNFAGIFPLRVIGFESSTGKLTIEDPAYRYRFYVTNEFFGQVPTIDFDSLILMSTELPGKYPASFRLFIDSDTEGPHEDCLFIDTIGSINLPNSLLNSGTFTNLKNTYIIAYDPQGHLKWDIIGPRTAFEMQILDGTFQTVVSTGANTFEIFGAPFDIVSTEELEGKCFTYHKICGKELVPIKKTFPKSKCGLIESVNHGLETVVNGNIIEPTIYVGKTSVTPDINGCKANVCVIDENFFTFREFGNDPKPNALVNDLPPIAPLNMVGIQVVLYPSDNTIKIRDRTIEAINNAMNGSEALTAFVFNDTSFRLESVSVSLPETSNFIINIITSGNRSFTISQQTGLEFQVPEGDDALYFIFQNPDVSTAGGTNFECPQDRVNYYYVYYTVCCVVDEGDTREIECVNGCETLNDVGEFVIPILPKIGTGCSDLIVEDITPQNDGLIIAPNDFQGGECLYFLNDTNINEGITNELKNGFYTVSTNNLTSSQFQLENAPICSIGSVFGNVINTSISNFVTFCEAGSFEYCVPDNVNEIDVCLAGAGGGQGFNIDWINGCFGFRCPGFGAPGGDGSLVTATISVTPGEIIYINVGGGGRGGSSAVPGTPSTYASFGGFNGGGTGSIYNPNAFDDLPHGSGGGGGASDIRVGGNSLNDRVVVAGGGGGGGGVALNGFIEFPVQGGGGGHGDQDGQDVPGDLMSITGVFAAGGFAGNLIAGGIGSGSGTFGLGGSATLIPNGSATGQITSITVLLNGGVVDADVAGKGFLLATSIIQYTFYFRIMGLPSEPDSTSEMATYQTRPFADSRVPINIVIGEDQDATAIKIRDTINALGGVFAASIPGPDNVIRVEVVDSQHVGETCGQSRDAASPFNTQFDFVTIREGQFTRGGGGGGGGYYGGGAGFFSGCDNTTGIGIGEFAGRQSSVQLVAGGGGGSSFGGTVIPRGGGKGANFFGNGGFLKNVDYSEYEPINNQIDGQDGYLLLKPKQTNLCYTEPGTYELTIPENAIGMRVELEGAGGQSCYDFCEQFFGLPSPPLAGRGGKIEADINLEGGVISPGDTVQINVGGTGTRVFSDDPSDQTIVQISDSNVGVRTNIDAGTSGFSVSVRVDGGTQSNELSQIDTAGIDATAIDNSPGPGLYYDIYDNIAPVRFWYNVDGATFAPPTPPGGRLVEIATVLAGMTDEQVAQETARAIDADSKFKAWYRPIINNLGGYNGGGDADSLGAAGDQPEARNSSGAGGGASDIRIGSYGLDERILVAGGGGGSAGFRGSSNPIMGGDGGGMSGLNAHSNGPSGGGGGGTLIAGGSPNGSFGLGGNGGQSGGGGGGGGWYGGGGPLSRGGSSEGGGGGGSGFVSPSMNIILLGATNEVATGGNYDANGSVKIYFTLSSTTTLPMGHFIQVPCGDSFNRIETIKQKHSGLFCAEDETGFPINGNTCILLTDGVWGDNNTDIGLLQDVTANANPFPLPAPGFSATVFETEICITPDDISVQLQDNKVDEISTSDNRFPGLNGLSYIVLDPDYCFKLPIELIQRDSRGSIVPVKEKQVGQFLEPGDTIFFQTYPPAAESCRSSEPGFRHRT